MLMLVVLATATARLSSPQISASPISFQDYPSYAVASGKRGAVVFSAFVDPKGRVLKCTVDKIIEEDFGALICRKMKGARFMPATNRAGAPVHGLFHNAMSFWLPGEKGSDAYPYKTGPDLVVTVMLANPSASIPRDVALAILFDADGKPVDCGPDVGETGAYRIACDAALGQLTGKMMEAAPGAPVDYVGKVKVAFVPDGATP